RFGRKTVDFLICRNCGSYIGARMQAGSRRFGIVNVRALQSLAQRLPEPAPMDYDGESADERLARRESRWTPVSSA
ncbi:MAG TPA: aldehyde-activating protein, partial [Gammaproteobacteria bacterium]|nr:aldehyde-activating protein [Gammaproteobacteria bacterium]